MDILDYSFRYRHYRKYRQGEPEVKTKVEGVKIELSHDSY